MAGPKKTEKDTKDAIAERRDAILKRMLNTPPKPRKGLGGAKKSIKGDSRG